MPCAALSIRRWKKTVQARGSERLRGWELGGRRRGGAATSVQDFALPRKSTIAVRPLRMDGGEKRPRRISRKLRVAQGFRGFPCRARTGGKDFGQCADVCARCARFALLARGGGFTQERMCLKRG